SSRFCERQTIRPEVSAPSGNSRTIDIALMVLPLPDSPIRPVVRPAPTPKDTPSITRPVTLPVDSTTSRSSTWSRGAPGAGAAPAPEAGDPEAATVDKGFSVTRDRDLVEVGHAVGDRGETLDGVAPGVGLLDEHRVHADGVVPDDLGGLGVEVFALGDVTGRPGRGQQLVELLVAVADAVGLARVQAAEVGCGV